MNLRERIEEIVCRAIEDQIDWESYYGAATDEPVDAIIQAVSDYISQNIIGEDEKPKDEYETLSDGAQSLTHVDISAQDRNKLRQEQRDKLRKDLNGE